MMRCSECNHFWKNRKLKPECCPRCGVRLNPSPINPTKLVVPIAMLKDEKLRHINALHKFEESAERSHAHGIQEGWIEALIWLESEVAKGRRRSA